VEFWPKLPGNVPDGPPVHWGLRMALEVSVISNVSLTTKMPIVYHTKRLAKSGFKEEKDGEQELGGGGYLAAFTSRLSTPRAFH
jgi:phage-related tail fiber protein